MEIIDTTIADVKIFRPKTIEDPRGYFSEVYNQRALAPNIGDTPFVQDNESYSAKPFTVRGLHYQAPPFAQAKLVRVLKGRIFDVVVDARKGAPTYGEWVAAELSAENRQQLFAPVGFLHGFMTLEIGTVVAYKVSNFYNGAADGAVHWASPSLGINWPAGSEAAILSEKDAGADDFDAFKSPFSA